MREHMHIWVFKCMCVSKYAHSYDRLRTCKWLCVCVSEHMAERLWNVYVSFETTGPTIQKHAVIIQSMFKIIIFSFKCVNVHIFNTHLIFKGLLNLSFFYNIKWPWIISFKLKYRCAETLIGYSSFSFKTLIVDDV